MKAPVLVTVTAFNKAHSLSPAFGTLRARAGGLDLDLVGRMR